MGHHVLVAVLHPRDNLLEEAPRIILGQPAALDDEVKQLPTRRHLSDHVYVRRRLNHFVQLDDVGMGEHLEDADFALDLLLHVERLDFLAVEDFDGHPFARGLVLGKLDLAKRPHAQGLPHLVVPNLHGASAGEAPRAVMGRLGTHQGYCSSQGGTCEARSNGGWNG